MSRVIDNYFGMPMQIARRKLEGMRDSLVTSSVWRTNYKKSLNLYPEFETVQLDFALPGCDACHLGSRISTLIGRLTGEPYDKMGFQVSLFNDVLYSHSWQLHSLCAVTTIRSRKTKTKRMLSRQSFISVGFVLDEHEFIIVSHIGRCVPQRPSQFWTDHLFPVCPLQDTSHGSRRLEAEERGCSRLRPRRLCWRQETSGGPDGRRCYYDLAR